MGNKKIIVSLTSWPKRINNVATVVKSLLNQDLEPDIIQINLSCLEFKKKEKNLPYDLRMLIKNDSRVQIVWVDRNDGVFKKLIPTLQKHYGEDYLLLSVDDDWIYRHDYIKMMVNYLESYNVDSFCLATVPIIGNRTIYRSSCFSSDFWEKLTDEVIGTRIDDEYIWHYLKCKNKTMGCYRPSDTPDITKTFNPVSPNSHNEVTGSYSPEDIEKAKKIISEIDFVDNEQENFNS